MKILIADSFEAWAIEELKRIAGPVVSAPGLRGAELARRVSELDPEILIVRSTKVTREVIDAARNLLLIIRAGSGVDNIDIASASARGIMVANCPGKNAEAVAELTMGLILALDRRIADNVIDLRNGRWNKKLYARQALGLKGRTLGIVGAGNIGTLVAKRALAFEMNVLYYHLGRHRRLADHPNARRAELDELLRESDVVSIHLPYSESTHHLIDERRLGLMKPTALLINTSRAGIVDEAALARALREGRLRGAGLDVFENEPPADAEHFDSPLRDVPNLYGTHHIGASTEQAQNAVAAETLRIVQTFKHTGQVLNCVNVRQPAGACMLVVRLRNRPGGLAHVFAHLSEAGINVEEMDHLVYDGGNAAVAHIRLDRQPRPEVLTRIREGHPNVLGVELLPTD